MLRITCMVLIGSLAIASPGIGQDWIRTIGSIPVGSGPRVVETPDTVRAGRAFLVTINTFGGSGCGSPAGVDLVVTGLLASVTPYDRVPRSDSAVHWGCPADFSPRPHPVRITFPTAGLGVIRVRGRDGWRSRIVERKVVVLPLSHRLTRVGADGAFREATAGGQHSRTNRTIGARPRPSLFEAPQHNASR
jgi:hypothetical protein